MTGGPLGFESQSSQRAPGTRASRRRLRNQFSASAREEDEYAFRQSQAGYRSYDCRARVGGRYVSSPETDRSKRQRHHSQENQESSEHRSLPLMLAARNLPQRRAGPHTGTKTDNDLSSMEVRRIARRSPGSGMSAPWADHQPIWVRRDDEQGYVSPAEVKAGARRLSPKPPVVAKIVYYHLVTRAQSVTMPNDYAQEIGNYRLMNTTTGEILQGPPAAAVAVINDPHVDAGRRTIISTLYSQYRRLKKESDKAHRDWSAYFTDKDGKDSFPIPIRPLISADRAKLHALVANLASVSQAINKIALECVDFEWCFAGEELVEAAVAEAEAASPAAKSPSPSQHSEEPPSDNNDDATLESVIVNVSSSDSKRSPQQKAFIYTGNRELSTAFALANPEKVAPPKRIVVPRDYLPPTAEQLRLVKELRDKCTRVWTVDMGSLPKDLRAVVQQCTLRQADAYRLNMPTTSFTDHKGRQYLKHICPYCELPMDKHKSSLCCQQTMVGLHPHPSHDTHCLVCGCLLTSHKVKKKTTVPDLPPLNSLSVPVSTKTEELTEEEHIERKQEEEDRQEDPDAYMPRFAQPAQRSDNVYADEEFEDPPSGNDGEEEVEVQTTTFPVFKEDTQPKLRLMRAHNYPLHERQRGNRRSHSRSNSSASSVVSVRPHRILPSPSYSRSPSRSHSRSPSGSESPQHSHRSDSVPSVRSGVSNLSMQSAAALALPHPQCNLFLEDLIVLREPLCWSCHGAAGLHSRKPEQLREERAATFKLPNLSYFTKFRDPRNPLTRDPAYFMRLFERDLKLNSVPPLKFEDMLIKAVNDEQIAEWVEGRMAERSTWVSTKEQFIITYADHMARDKACKELDLRTQKPSETVAEYTQEYKKLLLRADFREDNPLVISQLERGFRTEIRSVMQTQTNTQASTLAYLKTALGDNGVQLTLQKPGEFATVDELIAAATAAEKSMASTNIRREHGGGGGGKLRAAGRLPRTAAQHVPTAPSAVADKPRTKKAKTPAIAKLEVNAAGRPVNSSKSNNKRKDFSRDKKKDAEVRKERACFICGSLNHMQDICPQNKDGCKLCTGKGHLFKDCSKYRPRISHIQVSSPLTYQVVANGKHRMTVTSPKLPGAVCARVFLDTGAGFSCIKRSLVEKYQLKVLDPQGVKKFEGATEGLVVSRLGYVHIPITVFYLRAKQEVSCTFTKIFEVAEIREDFLLGTETAPVLYPGSDFISATVDMDHITNMPHHIKRSPFRGEAPILAHLLVVDSPSTQTSRVASESFGAKLLNEECLYDDVDEAEAEMIALMPKVRAAAATSQE